MLRNEIKMNKEELIDATEKCWIDWVEDGVLGCTYDHEYNELCLDMFCKYCQDYKCKCYE